MTSNSTTSVRRLPYWWRVTRYDPACRDERGVYPLGTWTSIADVGTAFDGVVLQMSQYEQVETAYVDAFVAFAEESTIEQVQVRSLECGDELQEGDVVSLTTAKAVVRQLLREQVICKLEALDNSFALHVGFDLYMYVGSTMACPAAERHARLAGLFVEPRCPSPLWPEEA